MDFVRMWWPILLAGAVILVFLVRALRRSGTNLSRFELFSRHNEDGTYALATLAVLFLLVLGGTLTQRRAQLSLDDSKAESALRVENLETKTRDRSIELSQLRTKVESLETALEEAEEQRDMQVLYGQIFDGRSRESIEGAVISISRHDPTRKERVRLIADQVQTDRSGRFEIHVPSLGPRGTLRAEVSAEGYSVERRWIDSVEDGQRLEIYLSHR